nr:SMR family transporter [Rhizobium halophytocola]
MTLTYVALAVAVLFEVAGTSLLQQTQQFTRPLPSIGSALCYVVAIYLLSFALRTLPVGIAYAIWSGFGIVLVSAIGYVVFRQSLDLPAVIGLGLIIAGILVVNLFSSTVGH